MSEDNRILTFVSPRFDDWIIDLNNTVTEIIQKSNIYEWSPDFGYGEPYDRSGDIERIPDDKKINFIKNGNEFSGRGYFLDDLYTGSKTATYMSGCGWHFETYGDYFKNEFEQELIQFIFESSTFEINSTNEEDEINEIKYELIDDYMWANDIQLKWIHEPIEAFNQQQILKILIDVNEKESEN